MAAVATPQAEFEGAVSSRSEKPVSSRPENFLSSGSEAAPTSHSDAGGEIELSVVMPCLNERLTVGRCVREALEALRAAGIAGEVVVADNGSTDGSQEIAETAGARVVAVEAKGYGNALTGGIVAARGVYVLMADADASYDFEHIPRFLEQLRAGQDLVMGNRFRGGIERGAMPPLHRYLGNPVLTGLGRLFFRSPCGDFHCGMRAFRRDSFLKMDIRSTGMEFASEMVVKASLLGMKVAEAPTTLKPDGRDRRPHLRTWRDGWRHLRFLLMYSPRWLFLYPGMALIALGAVGCALLLPGPRVVGGVEFDIHTLLYAFVLVLLGIAGSVLAVSGWAKLGFGNLDPQHMLRVVMPAVFSLTLGAQVIFSSFFLSILGLSRRR